MRGLLRNNYYSMQESMKLSIIVTIFVGAVVLFMGNSLAIMVLGGVIFLFPINIGGSLQADEASKWNKFEITMPVSRKVIVRCKYVSYLMLVGIGLLCSFVIVALSVLFDRGITIRSVLFSSFYGMSLSFFTGAFVYPLLLLFGAQKSELLLVLCAMLALGCDAVVAICCGWLGVAQAVPGFSLGKLSVGIVATVVSIVFFVLSYLVSVAIHGRKEF